MRRWLLYPLLGAGALAVVGVLVLAFAIAVAYPNLPTLEALTDYRPKVPLRVYSADGHLIGEFGEERRSVVRIDQVPAVMKQAILAAEDERFFDHGGVDFIGVLRAALANLFAGSTRQGASTITMQVARNFYLSRERTFTRKFHEALLAFKIEGSLTKDQILELYINQIFLGQRAYGFAAAARIYFGKPLTELDAAEAAMLAGLPKAPSRFNPVVNPQRARLRQVYVLRRMHELGWLTEEQFRQAHDRELQVRRDANEFAVRSEFVAELVRLAMVERFGEEAYTRGLRVYTTVLRDHQAAAYAAVRRGVLDYDRRRGYRGPERYVELPHKAGVELYEDVLSDDDSSDDLHPALVLAASEKEVRAYRKGVGEIKITGDGLRFARLFLTEKTPLKQRIRRGAVIRVQADAKGAWHIVQLPQVEAALVSIASRDGAIRALVGGFDFHRSQFNNVTQAIRQPGSSFKPFIYSAALEKGFSPASMVNDAPLVFTAAQTGSEPWEPKNYDGKFDGPMSVRAALARSKNLVMVRVLQAIGPQYAQDYIARFGFDPRLHPPYLTMALGAGGVTPLQMAAGYAVFANGGFRVEPYLIERVEDADGTLLMRAQPTVVGESAERVIDARNAFLMTSMMQDVVRAGTATRAMKLGRRDLAGKTGTTNDFLDAWFAGYQPSLVAVSWIGFSTPRTLGSGETGGSAALPMWIEYMASALRGLPEEVLTPPEGVITARVDPATGLREDGGRGVQEFFFHERLPGEPEVPGRPSGLTGRPPDELRGQVF
jgi:penicillin-binding protein 1A